ncbi:MAG: restriction endonuclease subunit S [Steroidobacteraceae bacterium]
MSSKTKTKTNATTEEGAFMLVPKLRFPEFHGVENWKARVVSQFAKITTGAKDTQNKVESGKYPFFVRSQTVERINSYSYDGEAVLTSGDGVGVGKNFHYIIGKFDFHQRVYCIYDFDKEVSGLFFYLYFSEHFGERVMRMSAKNSVDSVRMAMIAEMLVLLPPLAEQQKIAECLSSVDELLTAQARKVDALKTHKKGLMQQLFPREGETQPRLRFPEFQKAGEWELKRLSSEVHLISGMHLSPDQYSTTGEVPYFTGPSDFTNDIKSVTKWTKRSTNIAAPDDTLITVKGSGVGEVWYSTLQAVALGRQLMAVRVKHGASQFIFQFLLTKKTRFEDLGSGNLIPGLSRTDILDMEAHFPSPAEQQRIATCLSSLDATITAESQKLEALKTHKKGLMQQLFPSPTEGEA